MRVPVHQPLAAEDQPLVVEVDEDLEHRLVEARVHGEAVAREVEAVAEPPRLFEDRPARLLLPLPDPGDESLAPHLAPRDVAGLRQLALDHHLRRDPGMVEPRLPQHVVAAHPVPARQHVHQRVVEGMPHVQAAGDVRRRQQDREGRRPRPRVRAGPERIRRLPGGTDRGFGRTGVEGLFHRHRARSRHFCGPVS